MTNHNQKRPFDRARKPNPSSPEHPKDKPAESDPVEPHKPEADASEQDMRPDPTRWQRIKEHPAFKPVLLVGGLVAVGGLTVFTLRSPEGIKQVSATVLEKVPEFTGAAFQGIGEATSRRSPIEHMVDGYSRLQRYGTGGTETKIVQILPYSRGGSS